MQYILTIAKTSHSGFGIIPKIKFGDTCPYGSSQYGKVIVEIRWKRFHIYLTFRKHEQET